MGVGSGGQAGHGPLPPWIFIHGTNLVDKSLKVLFFVFFFAIFRSFFPLPPLPGRGLLVPFLVFFAIFQYFFPLRLRLGTSVYFLKA